MGIKKSLEEFKQMLFDKRGDEFIVLGEFVGMDKKFLAKHNVLNCGHEWRVTPHSLLSGCGCPECKKLKLRSTFAFTIKNAKELIESESGYKLLSNEYINAKTPLTVCCPKGHVYSTTYNRFQSGARCKICSQKTTNESKIIPVEIVYEMLIEDGLEFIKWVDGYKGRDSRFEYKCKEGHITNRSVSVYKQYRGCPTCNTIAFGLNHRGENSSSWKGGVTPVIYSLRNCLTQWKKDSMKDCKFRCVVTGKRFDDIHHLVGFDSILKETIKDVNVELKQDISDYSNEELDLLKNKILENHNKYPLGVCLTKSIHDLFHSIYGWGNNTIEQFEEFKQRYDNKEFNEVNAS